MATQNINSREEFLNLQISGISSVYKGKRNYCRCGCGGKYTATTYCNHDRSESTNDKLVAKRLEQAKELVRNGAEIDFGGTYIDVKTGSTKNGVDSTLTFYTDELKA